MVFKEVVSVVNYIKSCHLCTRLFRALCDKVGAEHMGLLFHSSIRWLSQVKAAVMFGLLKLFITCCCIGITCRFF